METKLVRIDEISATSKHPIFTSVYHLINEDMLKQCHKELDRNKAVGIDKVTQDLCNVSIKKENIYET